MAMVSGVGTARTTTARQLDAELRRAGFLPGRPPSDVASADELWCVLHACPDCLGTKLRYRPYLGAVTGAGARRAYRAMAVCEACGGAQEL